MLGSLTLPPVSTAGTSSRAGTCYGNLVSDGRAIQATDIYNANFGIRADGTLVVGYLTQVDAEDTTNPFVQLVSGVIWLVRNGTNYVDASKRVEFAGDEETGTLNVFAAITAARSAIGFDAAGRVYLVQVDGRTNFRGCVLLVDMCASI
jgi:N-acetylglucosamine-1-phosphodiester alpha-N-acetylglucosaminidase